MLGRELGAFGVTRALAYEHRFAAASSLPASSTPRFRGWRRSRPGAGALLEHARRRSTAELHLADLFEPRTSDACAGRALVRLSRASLYDLYQRIRIFRLGDEFARVTTPLLVCAVDEPWPGQAVTCTRGCAARLCRGGDDAGSILAWVDRRI